jgi:aspartyl-tRNA(Asn)/glutamyl-tRNA(Gln) amidotransferase subunit B
MIDTNTSLAVAMQRAWKTKIGLEIHAQIVTATKLFSPARHTSGESSIVGPNTCLSLFDIAYPGTLPRLNKEAVAQAVRAANILHCHINRTSMFERKHYFYQDLPLGYQITQQVKPIAENGRLDFDVQKDGKFLYKSSVRIARIQLEQDSGKSIHDRHPQYTFVDLNRAGVGLLEIVFEPDLQSSEEAASALKAMQRLLRHVNICDGNMQDGNMRCDVNISVSEVTEASSPDSPGSKGIVGNRVEVKNLNSLQRVSEAVEFELRRHIQLLEAGEQVPRETRKYDPDTGTTSRLRTKETSVDYRIFPDPDIPLLTLTDEEIAAMTSTEMMPETPDQTTSRLAARYDLTREQIERLIASSAIKYYEQTLEQLVSQGVAEGPQVQLVVYNWIFGDLMMGLNELGQTLEDSVVTPKQMGELIAMILPSSDETQGEGEGDEEQEGNTEAITISGPQAKSLLKALFHPSHHGASPTEIVIRNQWKLITSPKRIRELVRQSVNDPKNAKQRKKFFSGSSPGMVKFFFGDVMKLGQGHLDPKRIEKIVIEVLAEEGRRTGEGGGGGN